ncbi:MAG: undecaprenyldiphospho-muramoylpentapeptide beta-N-acetylglucosaminyltransferase [Lachnospiraceae bacterium]|jgi:UDP-N-acetylglucosamine--N-acetylmuramyl-(pentapeptide) pyrophosphoryl-undecaprenol N-acetylglucosamine transferase|nr:undecaprenyldiphospho-muramoylpentapeptide beta-N-acetylglucosaminyltransferase [Lachnospiraceae bacterium]
MKKIVLTGGGTAGHVTPNIALLPALREDGYDISYIGSYKGMEKQLIKAEGVPYYGIASGKLRRYFSWKNFSDPFRVLHGYFQSLSLLRKIKPDVIFSKGGFVSVPVVLAARKLHIPALIHESDMTPGLANRIAMKGAVKVCCNFPETVSKIEGGKGVLTGTPIRQELMKGDPQKGLAFAGFTSDKPVLLIIGGSQGSVFINNAVRGSLDELLQEFQIIHLCGKGHLDPKLDGREGYRQYEYISKELPDLFACASLIISRAGANAICELLALRKPNILIPLSKNASRGDQILNARSFEKQGFSKVLEEESINADILTETVRDVYKNRRTYIDSMNQKQGIDSITKIVNLLDEAISKKS